MVLALERDSKISSVLDRSKENCKGVRSGALLGCEGKMAMWRGLFCERVSGYHLRYGLE